MSGFKQASPTGNRAALSDWREVRDEDLTARMEPFDSFWEAPDDVERGFAKFGAFYRANYLSRLPVVYMTLALALTGYVFARRLWGLAAAVLALLLFLATIGALYVILVVPRLIRPSPTMAERMSDQSGKQFIAQITLTPEPAMVGKASQGVQHPGQPSRRISNKRSLRW